MRPFGHNALGAFLLALLMAVFLGLAGCSSSSNDNPPPQEPPPEEPPPEEPPPLEPPPEEPPPQTPPDREFQGAEGWTIYDDSRVTSTWEASNGVYTQSSHVANRYASGSRVYEESYHLGSYAFNHVALETGDFEFQVQATGLDNHGMGVMFRYRDNDNYYRLSFSPRWSYTRLEKRVNGRFHTVATNTNGYTANEPLNLRVVGRGPVVMVWVNDQPMFSDSDARFTSGTIGLYSEGRARFSAVSLGAAPEEPAVVLAYPLSHSVTVHNRVWALAHAVNVPEGAYAVFSLNGGQGQIRREGPPYTFDFPVGIADDHTVEVTLYGSDDQELSRDSRTDIGIGDYYLAVGDGITNGSGDFFPADNLSADGRMVGTQGHQATLADLLSAHTGRSTVVFNEGIPSQTVRDGQRNAGSVLERHRRVPLGQYFSGIDSGEVSRLLLAFGSTDSARGTASGIGLSEDDPAYANTFRRYMQDLVSWYTQYRPVSAGLIPPVIAAPNADVGRGERYENAEIARSAAQNVLIADYNDVVRGLTDNSGTPAATSTMLDIGPDMFEYFIDKPTLFENYHSPNSLGHAVMAHLWFNHLTGQTDEPFILRELTNASNNVQQNLLAPGNRLYVNGEVIRLQSAPEELSDAVWVVQGNDRALGDWNGVSFRVDRPVTLYVGYDSAATAVPDWLTDDFSQTELSVTGQGGTVASWRLYRKENVTGEVTLHPNHDDATQINGVGPANGRANYLILVVPEA